MLPRTMTWSPGLSTVSRSVQGLLFRRTSTLTVAEMSELLEFLMAWKAENMEAA